MTYEEAIYYITKSRKFGLNPGLHRIQGLLNLLGNPQKSLKFVHVAGTNGKGSVCAFIHSILMEAGYKTGLFISPHLQRFSERIRVNTDEITKPEIAEYITLIREKIDIMEAVKDEPPTEFDILTAMSFLHFAKASCDIVVLETGIGGIVDSTNIISEKESLLSVITSIGFDHMEYLGETLPEIAAKKAGIIKKGHVCAVYPAPDEVMTIFEDACERENARLIKLDEQLLTIKRADISGTIFDFGLFHDLEIRLPGHYQALNASLAVKSVLNLRKKGFEIYDNHIRKGLLKAHWPGRLEVVNNKPMVIVDGAHNPDGAIVLFNELAAYFSGKKFTFICGCMADKDPDTLFRPLAAVARRFITITPDTKRAMHGEELANALSVFHTDVTCKNNVRAALDYALSTAEPDEPVCLFGSLYFIGEARDYFGLE